MRHVATRRSGIRTTDRTGAISTDISTTVPPTVREPARERSWERKQREGQETSAYVVGLLEQLVRSNGGILASTEVPPMNDVLRQGTYKIPANGFWVTHFEQAFAAVSLANGSTTHPMTVASQAPGPSAVAPTVGNGVLVVAGQHYRTVPMRGLNVTVYGNPGTFFDIAVFIRPRTPSAGVCGAFA
jgi:hypothetical protein